jgi:hypothetical protein
MLIESFSAACAIVLNTTRVLPDEQTTPDIGPPQHTLDGALQCFG